MPIDHSHPNRGDEASRADQAATAGGLKGSASVHTPQGRYADTTDRHKASSLQPVTRLSRWPFMVTIADARRG